MSFKVLTAACALALLAGAAHAESTLEVDATQSGLQEETTLDTTTMATDEMAQVPASQEVIDAVKDAPPAIVSGSIAPTTSPTIDVPAAVSASMPVEASPTIEVSGTVVDTTAGVTTLDEAFAAISDTAPVADTAEPATMEMEGSGEKLEDYMKDAARPADEAATDTHVPMPPDGDDMMGY